ncbi:MAG: HAMP domain-containing sensor histidine kinase, partial [Ignavibacteriaceae bacterium]
KIGSERINTITKNLTEYAAADSGDLNEFVDVNKVIETAILITNNLIKKSTNNFQVEYGKDIPLIKGNEQQLEQVLINIISNACQSLKDNNSEIKVKSYFHRESNQVRINIKDKGIGINKEDLKYIMDPFFTTKRNIGGTGLGLSVSYAIIKNHGGSLSLSSEPNLGTNVNVSLPVTKNGNLIDTSENISENKTENTGS